MTDSSARFIFAGLCCLGLVVIWCGAAFEARRQKQTPTISQRHFRWRMVSALLWTLILGSLVYGTLFSWPLPEKNPVVMKRFLSIVVGSLALMGIAAFIMIFDFYLTAQTRRIQNSRLDQNLDEVARIEIERARLKKEALQKSRESVVQNTNKEGGTRLDGAALDGATTD